MRIRKIERERERVTIRKIERVRERGVNENKKERERMIESKR